MNLIKFNDIISSKLIKKINNNDLQISYGKTVKITGQNYDATNLTNC